MIGIDGSGRTHRLAQLAGPQAVWLPRFRGASDLDDVVWAAPAERRPLVVDDAHLRPPDLLVRLARAADEGARVLVARRPTVQLPELAALDAVVAATGTVELLTPLPDETVAALLRAAWPEPLGADIAARAVTAAGGSPAVAMALVGWSGRDEAWPPALTALVQRRMAILSATAAALVPLLAERVPLDPLVLARLTGVPAVRLADAIDELREAGLVVPDGNALVPAVAGAVRAASTPAARRTRGAALAAAVLDAPPDTAGTADIADIAAGLRELGVRDASVGALHLAVARRLAPTDPAGARTWAREALASLPAGSAERDDAALVDAEAALVLGEPGGAGSIGGRSDRWAVVRGLRAALDGRAGRAAEELGRGGAAGLVMAAPLRFGTGVPVDAGPEPSTTPADLLRAVATAAARPHDALPAAVEAADAAERTPALLLPDTPPALGAVLAVLAGDAPTADRLLARALAHGAVGTGRIRHVLLQAWVGLRTGRYGEALSVTGDGVGGALPGAREELLLACVAAGLARRSGDVAALRTAWAAAEPLLIRRAVDLWQLEQIEELAVAAARLRQDHRTEPVLAVLEQALAGLGRPAAWEAAMAWLRLQCAVVREDVAAAEQATSRLDRAVPPGPAPARPPDGLHRVRAQAVAARCWTAALRGEVDADAVVGASALLVTADLPWEASRLAGEAAIRATVPAVARRLLERARELASGAPPDRGAAPDVVLSEREREVAELVRAGRTHREIGAQLYLSPKTVEHHVARMRSKLGAATRAEFLAALARVLPSG